MAETCALKWAYRAGVLTLEEYVTFDEALAFGRYANERGHEDLQCIEVLTTDARQVFDRSTIELHWAAAAQTQGAVATPRPSIVFVAGPGGDWGVAATLSDPDRAEAEAARLGAILGEDRVRVEPGSS